MLYIDVISCNSLNLPVVQSFDIICVTVTTLHLHAGLQRAVHSATTFLCGGPFPYHFIHLLRTMKYAKISTFITKI
jgi:hypothetical protein